MLKVFTGENSYALTQAVTREVAGFAGEAEKYDGEQLSAGQMPEICMGATLFASERLIIIRELSANKYLWQALDGYFADIADTSTIILVEPKPDKRTKAWKWLQSHAEVREFKLLQDREIPGWLMRYATEIGLDLPRPVAEYLVEYVGTDQWELHSAVTKLKLNGGAITKDTIRHLLEPHPQASAFELLDAVLAGRQDEAARKLDIIRRTEDPYRFLGLLGSQLYALAVCTAATHQPAQQIAKDAGLHPFVVQKTMALARNVSRGELRTIVAAVTRCDRQLKSSGEDPWVLVGLALGEIASVRAAP